MLRGVSSFPTLPATSCGSPIGRDSMSLEKCSDNEVTIKMGRSVQDSTLEQYEMDSENELNIQPGKKWPQYLAALTATLGGLCTGSIMGWTSPALPYLQEPYNVSNATVQDINDDEASWIGSLAPLGALFGAAPAGYSAEIMGRKSVLLLLCLPSVIGWLLIILSQKQTLYIYAGRFVTGLAIGGITVVTPLYCEEIAEDSVRGTLGVYLDLMVTVGILWAYLIGAFDQYFWLSISSCALPVIFAGTFVWMPESPVYLLSKGKNTKAKESLHWLRGADHIPEYDVSPELFRMQRLLNESAKVNCNSQSHLNCKNILATLSWSSPIVKSLRIVFGLMFFQQMSGITAVVFYTVDIFQNAGGSWSPQNATIVIGVVQVIATFFPSLIVEIIGRRVLLILSVSSMALCLGGLSLHSYLNTNQLQVEQGFAGFIPLTLVALYIIMFSIGFGPLPWFMMAELVPSEAKGWASSMSVCLNWALVFAVTNLFPNLITDLGPTGTYGLFSVICVIGTFFVFTSVPETRGKSREEIQLWLQGKNIEV